MIRKSFAALLLLSSWFVPHHSVAESTISPEANPGLKYEITTFECSYDGAHFTEILMIEASAAGYAGGRDWGASGSDCKLRGLTQETSDPLAVIAPIDENSEPTFLLAVLSGTLPDKITAIKGRSFASMLADHLNPIYIDASGRWVLGPWQWTFSPVLSIRILDICFGVQCL
jgi:hypothetical protein